MSVSEAQVSTDLIRLTASEMAERVRAREITASELVEAHIARIEETHDELNAVVVPLFDRARREAVAADEKLKGSDDEGLPPLFGVPITIKEFFDVVGTKTTAGIEQPGLKAATGDAVTVAQLREAGAIVLGKTNVPQLGLSLESDNPVYGKTSNPLDITRSSGGSSGGEASIIAAHGSPLGLGSDGGGSIRVPSHFCGLVGLMPTAGRLSMKGHWQLPSFPPGWSKPGPIARSVQDLDLAMRCMTDPRFGRDAELAPTDFPDWRQVDLSKLRIGYYTYDGFVTPSPAIQRGVEEAAQQLRQFGATVVPFEPPAMTDAWEINLGLFYADGGKWMRRLLGKSAVDLRVKKALLNASLPTSVRRTIPAVMESIGQTTMAKLLRLSRFKRLTAYQLQQVGIKQQQFCESFIRRMADEQVDALLCPPFASVAMKHDSPDIVVGYGYTFVFNMLGLPAGSVPVTTVQAHEESDRAKSKDGLVLDLLRAEEGSAGLPVGAQVVGKHWREDVVLALMAALSGYN